MNNKIMIENLKCHGCANTIKRNISALEGVTQVEVSHEDSSVSIEYDGATDRSSEFAEVLRGLGYPQVGENTTGRVVKSYLSCAVGRMTKKD